VVDPMIDLLYHLGMFYTTHENGYVRDGLWLRVKYIKQILRLPVPVEVQQPGRSGESRASPGSRVSSELVGDSDSPIPILEWNKHILYWNELYTI
jgi:hypothetical protein